MSTIFSTDSSGFHVETFVDNKMVIRILKLKNDRQCNNHRKRDRRRYIDLRNNTEYLKIEHRGVN